MGFWPFTNQSPIAHPENKYRAIARLTDRGAEYIIQKWDLDSVLFPYAGFEWQWTYFKSMPTPEEAKAEANRLNTFVPSTTVL